MGRTRISSLRRRIMMRRAIPLLRKAPKRVAAPAITRAETLLTTTRESSSVPALRSDDHSYDYPLEKLGDPSKRAFTYLVLGGARFVYASAARLIAVKFIASMSASADVLALASTEVDIGAIDAGSSVTVKWRGKPVFVRHRTEEEISKASSVPTSSLRDPQEDGDRVKDPEWLVTIGVCTHLGCVPLAGAGDFGGYFCPCHGSHYDTSGRIRKGPAPLNLDIPPYEIDTEEEKLLIG